MTRYFPGLGEEGKRFVGYVRVTNEHYYPHKPDEPGTHWFDTMSGALKYLLLGDTERGHLIVQERGEAIRTGNMPTSTGFRSVTDAINDRRASQQWK